MAIGLAAELVLTTDDDATDDDDFVRLVGWASWPESWSLGSPSWQDEGGLFIAAEGASSSSSAPGPSFMGLLGLTWWSLRIRIRTPWSEKLLDRNVDSHIPGNDLLEWTVTGFEAMDMTWTT